MRRHESVAVVRVRYADTDQMRVAYHGRYLEWFEVGRCEWLRDQGSSYRELETRHGVMLPVIEAHCQYRVPARYDDELEVRSRCTLLSPVRLQFDYDVVRRPDGTRIATGRTVHAAIDAGGRPTRLPAHVRDLLRDAKGSPASHPALPSAGGRDVE